MSQTQPVESTFPSLALLRPQSRLFQINDAPVVKHLHNSCLYRGKKLPKVFSLSRSIKATTVMSIGKHFELPLEQKGFLFGSVHSVHSGAKEPFLNGRLKKWMITFNFNSSPETVCLSESRYNSKLNWIPRHLTNIYARRINRSIALQIL